jgi:outer membrane protein assembly factor BamC
MQNSKLGRFGRQGLILALLVLAGCSSADFQADTVDYKSAGEKKTPSLVYPPDMTTPVVGSRYSVPEGTTLSQYNKDAAAQKKPGSQASAVMPVQEGMKIERLGTDRWLVVNKTPAELYPKVKDFWEQSGFLLLVDSPKTGIMETDWAENRAKIPQDIIRRSLGKVLDSLYSTGERDKFRTRLEVNPQGQTEIYIAHRGAIEKLVGQDNGSSMWTDRPSDPGLEVDMLSRLMVFLGSTNDQAKAAAAKVNKEGNPAPISRVQNNGAQSALLIALGFDRAWREVGLGLDRSNFTVEDRDRTQGIYYVRFVNSKDFDSQSEPGFFAKYLSFSSSSKSDDLKKAKRYRVLVKTGADNSTRVTVLDGEGGVADQAVVLQILTILDGQITK